MGVFGDIGFALHGPLPRGTAAYRYRARPVFIARSFASYLKVLILSPVIFTQLCSKNLAGIYSSVFCYQRFMVHKMVLT